MASGRFQSSNPSCGGEERREECAREPLGAEGFGPVPQAQPQAADEFAREEERARVAEGIAGGEERDHGESATEGQEGCRRDWRKRIGVP